MSEMEKITMTRGYFCIVNGKKVEKAVYLNSDAYISYYGFKILTAIIDNKIKEWTRETEEYTSQFGTPVSAFSLDWIRKNPNVKMDKYDFYEYGYIYNLKTGMLKVYNYGKLIYSIPENEREKYLYFFKYAEEIEPYLCYNPEKMDYNYNKPLKSIIANASIDELKEYVEKGNVPRMKLSNYHSIVAGHSTEAPHYLKKFTVSNKPLRSANFIVAKPYVRSTWEILIQLPYIRSYVATGFPTEAAAVKRLRAIISDNKERLIRYMDISDMYINWQHQKNTDLESVFAMLDEEWKKAPWYTFGSSFSVSTIKANYRRFVEGIKTKEKKD